jgi:ketosteroid isomerase-like protein
MARPSVSEDPAGYFNWFYDAASNDPADHEGIAERWHEDAVVVQVSALPGTKGTFEGHQGVSDMLAELREASEDLSFTPVRVLDLGDGRYVVELAHKLRGRASDIVIEATVAHVVTMRGERAERIEAWVDWDRALKSIGRAG